MDRRHFLRTTGATVGAAGVAGCLGALRGNPNTTLSKPSGPHADADFSYPTWGERMPDVTLPAATADGSRSLRDLSRPTFVTFFFSHCRSVCPVLIGALRNVQTHALNRGYGDAVRFHPVTFDPERDDAERLRTFAAERNVALDAGNWAFLRPGSVARAKAVVEEEFGVAFRRQPREGGGYMFQHVGLILLANADGYVERAYQTTSPDPGRLIADLKELR